MESTLKRPHIFVPALLKFLHQTGAKPFARSRAVRHDGSRLGNSGQVLFDFVQRHPNRFWYHRVRFRPSSGVSYVNYREIFSGVHSPFQLFDRDSRSVSHRETSLANSNSRCRTVAQRGGEAKSPMPRTRSQAAFRFVALASGGQTGCCQTKCKQDGAEWFLI